MQVMRSQRGIGAIGLGVLVGVGIIALFLFGMGALRFFSDERVCVQRTIYGEDNEVVTVSLHVDVNAFNLPSSFMLAEQIPLGWTFVDASTEPTSVRDGTYSWFFWRGPGMLPVKDGVVSYRVRAHSIDAVTGTLIVGNVTGDSDYLRIPIGREKQCV